jgi:nucleotide-binding universal stress UspA family protein
MNTFYSKILIAYDGSSLSEKALKMAITLAKQHEKVELDVISVSNPNSAAIMGSTGIYNKQLFDEFKEHAEKIVSFAKENLSTLPNKVRAEVLEGNPGKIIVDYAMENNCDLVVMGSRGLSGLAEVFLGSTSHYVVQRCHCPVFIIK